eukprot:m.307686 g.307686  ORF g.307686 m.307686 type:complete len:114 (+) comp42624_c0_seq1:73-414(+)
MGDTKVDGPAKSGEAQMPSPGSSEQTNEKKIMEDQDAKFKAKYGLARPKGAEILQRRISRNGKGQYFDSGDYNASNSKPAAGPPVLRSLIKTGKPIQKERKVSALAGPSPGPV